MQELLFLGERENFFRLFIKGAKTSVSGEYKKLTKFFFIKCAKFLILGEYEEILLTSYKSTGIYVFGRIQQRIGFFKKCIRIFVEKEYKNFSDCFVKCAKNYWFLKNMKNMFLQSVLEFLF